MMKKGQAKDAMKKAIKLNDLDKINQLMLEYPWLTEESSLGLSLYDDLDLERAVISAVGIMEDELAGPVRVEDVVRSVIIDFRKNMNEIELFSVLDKLERQGFIQKRGIGWVLTAQGAEICDQSLNEIGF